LLDLDDNVINRVASSGALLLAQNAALDEHPDWANTLIGRGQCRR
jgi:hypothetical protein